MDEYLRANQKLWDEWTAEHENSPFYDVKGFKDGKERLKSIELGEVGDVRGRTLPHLQCHFWLDTLAWARHGAAVTGVDLSDESISLAALPLPRARMRTIRYDGDTDDSVDRAQASAWAAWAYQAQRDSAGYSLVNNKTLLDSIGARMRTIRYDGDTDDSVDRAQASAWAAWAFKAQRDSAGYSVVNNKTLNDSVGARMRTIRYDGDTEPTVQTALNGRPIPRGLIRPRGTQLGTVWSTIRPSLTLLAQG